jgi:RNA polymerase sigma-70 factor (ECF subfamily)
LPGNAETWRELLARHGAGLVLFARQWLQTHADAEDAVQDAFVRLLKARNRPNDALAYLYASVRSAAIDSARTRSRRKRVDEKRSVPESVFELAPELTELSSSVETALAQLPDEQREVVVMKIWGGLTFAQIAGALDVSANTVASRYRYAIERLETVLAHEVRND